MDRLVAVNGIEVDGCSHEQVVDKICQNGNGCSLLVVDRVTDQMYKLVSSTPVWQTQDSFHCLILLCLDIFGGVFLVPNKTT